MSLKQGLPHLAANSAAESPSRIGNYEILGILGRGESATIYLGRELFPPRDVAIKVYDALRLSSEDRKVFRSLFLKETLLAKRLTHPNITQVYDAAADDQRAYIVMEYAREGSLDRFCTPGGTLPPQRVAELLESCCDALSYAHAQGVIHRDLKPANILLSADGQAKVSDFGVAFSNLAFDSTRNLVVGSPAYMAPEQIEGKPASIRSDIYSLGIVLYKMLVGRLPFPLDSPAALTTRILLGNIPGPGEADPSLPPAFDVIFARATARDPAMRYASWEELAADLRELAEPVVAGAAAADRHKEQLKALPFFQGFSDATLAEAVGMGRWFELRAGAQLVGEDDPGHSFFILTRGQVRATRRGTLLAIRGAGECLAETSFLRKGAARRFSSLAAVTDCSLVEFNPDVLWLASPECMRHFHEAFLPALAARLEGAESALAEMLAAKNVTLF